MSGITKSRINSIDLYAAVTTQQEMIGAIAWDENTGKAFRYALNGGSALVAGNLLQEAVRDTQFVNMAVGTAGAVGDAFIQVTNGTTTVVPQQYRGGSIHIYTAGTDLIGDEYTILDVTGTLTSGGAMKVWIDRPLRYAVTTSATVNMIPSPWAGVIQAPASTLTGMVVGGAIYAIPASTSTVFQYGWVQTHGVFNALSDGQTAVIGSDLGAPSATAGSTTVYAAGSGHQRVGIYRIAAVLGKGVQIFLQID